MAAQPDVLAIVVHPHLSCPLSEGTTRYPSFAVEICSSIEGSRLLALGLRSEILLVLIHVAVEAREDLASLVAYTAKLGS